MAGAGLTWTKERIELLTKLWTEGLSASQIAAELGENVSRNAVISKAHRLGLAHGAPKVASTPRPPKPSRPPEPCPTDETSEQADPALAPTTVNPQPKITPKEARPREDATVPAQAVEETRPEVDGAVPVPSA
jgi:GcrA cell cycle regulator